MPPCTCAAAFFLKVEDKDFLAAVLHGQGIRRSWLAAAASGMRAAPGEARSKRAAGARQGASRCAHGPRSRGARRHTVALTTTSPTNHERNASACMPRSTRTLQDNSTRRLRLLDFIRIAARTPHVGHWHGKPTRRGLARPRFVDDKGQATGGVPSPSATQRGTPTSCGCARTYATHGPHGTGQGDIERRGGQGGGEGRVNTCNSQEHGGRE